MTDIETLKEQAQKDIKAAGDLKALQAAYKTYLGKQGKLTQILSELKNLPEAQRKKTGKEANEAKKFLQENFDKKSKELKEKAIKEAQEKEWIDVTAPGKKVETGHLHPLTLTKRR